MATEDAKIIDNAIVRYTQQQRFREGRARRGPAARNGSHAWAPKA